MKKCIDCEHFKVRYGPYKQGGVIWDAGLAECERFNLVADFTSKQKLKRLECVPENLLEADKE